MKRDRLCILGATGSIGVNTLAVAAMHPQRYEVFALTGHRRIRELARQCIEHRPRYAAVPDAASAELLQGLIDVDHGQTRVLHGPEALEELAAHPDVDTVMGAIVGMAGLKPCLAAAAAGKRLLLANKEALVVGGRLFMDTVDKGGAQVLPVDSEHCAIHQCLPPAGKQALRRIVLTASGGPFRDWPIAQLAGVTPEQAVAHPNWSMGRKISVDSATMMNKVLEVIEARWLFDLPSEQIDVLLHPQSVVHSMVELIDGSVIAQLGTPDMRVPIAYAMAGTERIENGSPTLDLVAKANLGFERPDVARFPSLPLAWQVLRGPAGAPVVLNAANEEAVSAFLDRRIRFTDIHAVVAGTLDDVDCRLKDDAAVDDIVALNQFARRHAALLIDKRSAAL